MLNRLHWELYELRDPRFWQYFYNTVFLMLGIPFGMTGSLILAVLLAENIPLGDMRVRVAGVGLSIISGAITLGLLWFLGFPNLGLLGAILWIVAALGLAFNVVAFRTIFYLPQFTSGVAIMILWKALYNPETGPINHVLTMIFQSMGLDVEPPAWLSSVTWAKPALIFMGFWIGVGGTSMLLYLAGLSNVPQELVDASHVDGASTWQRFRHVIWPQLAPTTFFILIRSIIGGLQGGFEQARVMTGGGPAGSTTTLSYYIYNKAFQDLDLGYAAAISWVLFVVIFVATALNWQFGKNLEVD
jgi:multiple sugar transport system permease protein